MLRDIMMANFRTPISNVVTTLFFRPEHTYDIFRKNSSFVIAEFPVNFRMEFR
jgi:hypothetical protein